MNQQAFSYREQGKTFLAQASTELAQNDIRQASEKGWGAAAQMAKAIASERSWPHNDHRSLYRTVRQLVAETHDEESPTYNLPPQANCTRISTKVGLITQT